MTTKTRGMDICLFGDYDPEYPREVIIRRGLEKNGVTVHACNCLLKYQAVRSKKKVCGLLIAYPRLLARFKTVRHSISWIIVAHNNHAVVPLAWLLSKLNKLPLVIDAFDPAYRTAVMKGMNPVRTRVLYFVEKISLRLAQHILVTTAQFKKLYMQDYKIPEDRFIVLPVGADQEKFRHSIRPCSNPNVCRVVYWGNFHPHHGVGVIVKAANLLSERSDIEFILAGSGGDQEQYREVVESSGVRNVRFTGHLPDEELIDLISEADVCLGIFSSHTLALCSITNKVFQALAMAKPVITEDSAAVRACFKHKEHLYVVPPDDPEALAQAIVNICDDDALRRVLGENARAHFESKFTEVEMGNILLHGLGVFDKAGGGVA